MNNKDKVIIFDTTLRDGEQSPGISLNKAEKLEIALALAKMNVDVIEAGFPIASNGDFEAVQNIAKNVEGPTICGLARAVDGDIDRCWEAIKPASKSRIHTFIATSPIHMEHKWKINVWRIPIVFVLLIDLDRLRISFQPPFRTSKINRNISFFTLRTEDFEKYI